MVRVFLMTGPGSVALSGLALCVLGGAAYLPELVGDLAGPVVSAILTRWATCEMRVYVTRMAGRIDPGTS